MLQSCTLILFLTISDVLHSRKVDVGPFNFEAPDIEMPDIKLPDIQVPEWLGGGGSEETKSDESSDAQKPAEEPTPTSEESPAKTVVRTIVTQPDPQQPKQTHVVQEVVPHSQGTGASGTKAENGDEEEKPPVKYNKYGQPFIPPMRELRRLAEEGGAASAYSRRRIGLVLPLLLAIVLL